jgi:hypothetical protein
MKPKVIKNRIEFNLYPDDESYQQAVSLGFDVNQDMSLEALHRMCRYFALCLGFAESSVDEVFGEESYDDLC